MAATAAQLSDGHMVRNVVLFSVPVYELSGPTLTKIALTAAGAIRPEGRDAADNSGTFHSIPFSFILFL